MNSCIRIVALVSIIAAPSAVFARHQITKTAASGQATNITDMFSCNGGALSPKIGKAPANGKAEIVVVREAVSAAKLKAKTVGCEGMVTDIHYVRYTSNPGYKGPDQIEVIWNPTIFGGEGKTYKFSVK